ncbi:hypothetical protein [Limnobacter sp.]|uniref:hypothetical protein n=1 Tax=Limnobacter sp. TaxID=2003368 RepID=UPI0025C0D09C|nr:hypothetical protein [Limnobacter sp.]
MVKIEKGIPCPPDRRGTGFQGVEGGTRVHAYLHDLEIGDSIRFDTEQAANRTMHAYQRLKKAGHLSPEYTLVSRRMTENHERFVRIFRVK